VGEAGFVLAPFFERKRVAHTISIGHFSILGRGGGGTGCLGNGEESNANEAIMKGVPCDEKPTTVRKMSLFTGKRRMEPTGVRGKGKYDEGRRTRRSRGRTQQVKRVVSNEELSVHEACSGQTGSEIGLRD